MTQIEQQENWWKKEDFVDYLKQTLIPDLRDSGQEETAKDFRICVEFMTEPCITMIDRNKFGV